MTITGTAAGWSGTDVRKDEAACAAESDPPIFLGGLKRQRAVRWFMKDAILLGGPNER